MNAHTHTSDGKRHKMSSLGDATLYTEWLGAYICILTQILSGFVTLSNALELSVPGTLQAFTLKSAQQPATWVSALSGTRNKTEVKRPPLWSSAGREE